MNRYIAFLKVFERNSFSDAARDLGYTQSAVSQMIKSLEEELGVTLLVRSRSGVALTYEGRHLLPYIRDTVNAYRMLQSQAAGFSGLEQGTIRLGTFTSVSSYLLPPAMERFRRLHSGIRFELYQGLYYEIEDWVREGVVDFGFTDMLRTIPFPCEPIYQDTMLVVLPEGHPLGENIFIQVDELAAEPFILLESRESFKAGGHAGSPVRRKTGAAGKRLLRHFLDRGQTASSFRDCRAVSAGGGAAPQRTARHRAPPLAGAAAYRRCRLQAEDRPVHRRTDVSQ